VLGVFGYLLSNFIYARYLELSFMQGAGELTIFASAFAGAAIGFLWFNAYPAQVSWATRERLRSADVWQ